MSYRYCLLPGGNEPEFPELEAEALARGIALEYSELSAQGRLYRISEVDVRKLPTDEKGPYFGDAMSGHSLTSPAYDGEKCRIDLSGSNWVKARCLTCNGHGLIGGFVNGAAPGYESHACPDCNRVAEGVIDERWHIQLPIANDIIQYRLICRDNSLTRADSFADAHKGSWVSTPLEAIQGIKERFIDWMRWSFALFIEDTNGRRTWVYSIPGAAEILDPPKKEAS